MSKIDFSTREFTIIFFSHFRMKYFRNFIQNCLTRYSQVILEIRYGLVIFLYLLKVITKTIHPYCTPNNYLFKEKDVLFL